MAIRIPLVVRAPSSLLNKSAPPKFKSNLISFIRTTSHRFKSTTSNPSPIISQAAPSFHPRKKQRFPIVPIALALASITALGYALNSGIVTIDLHPKTDDFSDEIERQLQANPLIHKLRQDEKFTESRPHLSIPALLRQHSFTGGDMISPDKIPVPPVVFTTKDGSEFYSIIYLGRSLSGHPGIVHGGLLATLMDEGLARTCFNALPNKTGLTANLTMNYRAPCKAGQWVVLTGTTVKVEGRKAWSKGDLSALGPDGEVGKVFVEGEAMYVEPKNAKLAGALMRVVS